MENVKHIELRKSMAEIRKYLSDTKLNICRPRMINFKVKKQKRAKMKKLRRKEELSQQLLAEELKEYSSSAM